jgi:hypothetical protein
MLLEFSLPTVMYGIDLFLSVSFEVDGDLVLAVIDDCFATSNLCQPIDTSSPLPSSVRCGGLEKDIGKAVGDTYNHVHRNSWRWKISVNASTNQTNMMEYHLHHTIGLLGRTPAAPIRKPSLPVLGELSLTIVMAIRAVTLLWSATGSGFS